jgi:hypothetical protein
MPARVPSSRAEAASPCRIRLPTGGSPAQATASSTPRVEPSHASARVSASATLQSRPGQKTRRAVTTVSASTAASRACRTPAGRPASRGSASAASSPIGTKANVAARARAAATMAAVFSDDPSSKARSGGGANGPVPLAVQNPSATAQATRARRAKDRLTVPLCTRSCARRRSANHGRGTIWSFVAYRIESPLGRPQNGAHGHEAKKHDLPLVRQGRA